MLTATTSAQAPPDVDQLLTRVGERIAEYYKRAQNVICTEKSTVQPIGRDFGPIGFARTVESELHVESEAGDAPGEANVIREVRKVNGRPPRDKDKKDRDGCTDPNPLSTEPLAFLLPAHRSEYRFAAAGVGKGKDRNTLLIEFTSSAPEGKGELIEDEQHADCFSWSMPVVTKGRVWVDASTYDVLRVEQRIAGPGELKVSRALQRRHNFSESAVVVERHDLTIRYKKLAFRDPEEDMLVPESIETITVVRGVLQSNRRSQTFSDYHRFLTGARVVK